MLTLFVVVFNVVTIAYGLDCDRHVSDLGAPWSSGLADYPIIATKSKDFCHSMLHLSALHSHKDLLYFYYSRSVAESHGDERSALQPAAETVSSACAACARPRGCAQFLRPTLRPWRAPRTTPRCRQLRLPPQLSRPTRRRRRSRSAPLRHPARKNRSRWKPWAATPAQEA